MADRSRKDTEYDLRLPIVEEFFPAEPEEKPTIIPEEEDIDIPDTQLPLSKVSSARADFRKLHYRLLLKILVYLDLKELLQFTAVCSYSNSFYFNKEFLKHLSLRVSFPLRINARPMTRGELIECARKTDLMRTHQRYMKCTALTSDYVSQVLKFEKAQGHLLFFTVQNTRLQVWELAGEKRTVFYSTDCIPDIVDCQLEPGKLGLVGKSDLQVKYFHWETLQPEAIISHTYPMRQQLTHGSLYFYVPTHLIVAYFNDSIFVFSETLVLLRSFRDNSCQLFQSSSLQAHPSLPHLVVINPKDVLVFDVSKELRKPVFRYEIPTIFLKKAKSVLVTEGERIRCFVIIQSGLGPNSGFLLINARIVNDKSEDFSIVKTSVFVYQKCNMRLIQYQLGISGVQKVRSVKFHERFVNVSLCCREEKGVLLAQKDHSANTQTMVFFDFFGWSYYRYNLNDYEVETVTAFPDFVILTGKCRANQLKIVLLFHYFESSDAVVQVKLIAERAEKQKENQRKALEITEKMREERAKKLREDRKAEKAAKKLFKEKKNGRYWKSSEKEPTLQELIEDFSIF